MPEEEEEVNETENPGAVEEAPEVIPVPQPMPPVYEVPPPEAQKPVIDDGISDLFFVPDDPDTDDVVAVDMDYDIIDADEDGTLDDATTVSEEDIMGDDFGQSPLDGPGTQEARKKRLYQPRYRNYYNTRETPDRGIQGIG